MPIVCPHCATSYAIDAEKLGGERTVRCARCREVWVARLEPELVAASDVEWSDTAHPPEPLADDFSAPLIDSPSIAADWPSPGTELVPVITAPPAEVIDVVPVEAAVPKPRGRTGRKAKARSNRTAGSLGLPSGVAAMCALIGALLVWRADVVRLMPQTAILYRSIGLGVNLRGLSFSKVELGRETVDGQPVLVVEGEIADDLKRPVEIPKLRFVVRDAKGTAIYAWNATPEQNVIQPGERVTFRSRLAQPPAEAHSIDVRFFHKRDLAAGAA